MTTSSDAHFRWEPYPEPPPLPLPQSALRPPTRAWEYNPFLPLIHVPSDTNNLPAIPEPPLPPPPLYTLHIPYPEPPAYTWDSEKMQWVATHPLPLPELTPRKAAVLNRPGRAPYSLHDADPIWDATVNDAEVCPVDEANILTSEVAGKPGMHKVALDIDLPAKLLPSSTPGHWHLYIDCDVPWEVYTKLLDTLVEAGVIEVGYARASKLRGYTSVRPPWMPKTEDERANGGISR